MALTPRENALRAYKRETPEYMPDIKSDTYNFLIYELLERGPALNEQMMFGGGGYDWFGVKWKFVPEVNAPMVDPDEPHFMEDISEWREKVKFPDLDSIDWAAAAKRDLSNPKYDPNKLGQVVILNGPFERMHALMGFENALCAVLTDPENSYDYFGAVIDYKIKLIDKILEHYPIDIFDFHDDYGHQKNSFFSADVFNSLLKPHIKRLTTHLKEKGALLQWHSCGYIQNLIPHMIDAGIEHWSSCQAINNIRQIASEYGDRITILGGFDLDEYKKSGITPEELEKLVGARIDDICRGGCVIPFGLSAVPGLSAAVAKAIDKRCDFFKKPENLVLPN